MFLFLYVPISVYFHDGSHSDRGEIEFQIIFFKFAFKILFTVIMMCGYVMCECGSTHAIMCTWKPGDNVWWFSIVGSRNGTQVVRFIYVGSKHWGILVALRAVLGCISWQLKVLITVSSFYRPFAFLPQRTTFQHIRPVSDCMIFILLFNFVVFKKYLWYSWQIPFPF